MNNFCPNCGSVTGNTSRFCGNCGHSLSFDSFSIENFLKENKPNEMGVTECPFCIGKGIVDSLDVERLKDKETVVVGTCSFCEGVGRVNIKKIINYQNSKESISNTKVEETKVNINSESHLPDEDRLSGGLKVLSFCLPIVGVILYFTNKNSNPKTAKSACYSSLWGWGIAVIISIIFFLISMGVIGSSVYENLDDYDTIGNLDSTSLNSSTFVADSTKSIPNTDEIDYQLELMDSKSRSYSCRNCGKDIPWIGSYYWTTYRDNNSLKTNFTQLEDLHYAGDEMIDTPEYSEENTISRGIFCTYDCAYKNAKIYTDNNEFPY